MNSLPLDRLVMDADPTQLALIASLLAARAASAAAGNRRALFTRMDQLLADASPESIAGAEPSNGSRAAAGQVRITRLRLRNWKAFERADLVLPAGSPGKAMVVVGGANGYGKSSILEAYALSLFGPRAFSDIGFLISGAGRRGDQRRSYRAIIERSLHRSARAREEAMCSVVLDFDCSDGPFSIERKWYFDEQGGLIEEDEELLLRVGTDLRPLDVPEGQNQHDWYQAEIERRVMPADLAPFFLFDGEQIDRWAERELSEQVRQALTRVLGLVDVHSLAADLIDYARDRERGASVGDGQALEKLDVEVDALSARLTEAQARLGSLDAALAALRETRETSLGSLSQISARSHADLQVALEAQHRLEAERKRLGRELTNVLADDGPILFAGTGLIARTRRQIEREQAPHRWRLLGDEIAMLWERFANAEPALEEEQAAALHKRFVRACAGDAAAGPIDARHHHLGGQAWRTLIDRLDQAGETAVRRVANAVATLATVDAALAESRIASARHEQDLERVAILQQELGETTRMIAETEEARHDVLAEMAAIREQLDPQRTRRDALRQLMAESEPRLRAAERARTVARGILAGIDQAADAEHERFADAVTTSFRALSHKDQIRRVEISREGGLRLLDRELRDITDYRLSAGETQLFAMALIAAVGALIGDRLPLVIDTPLGRLDTEHRQRILDLLARRTAQTVLLTQPEELTPAHIERIRDAMAGTIQLDHAIDKASGIGVSSVAEPQRAAA
jgi:DNA sulfur modification protein DndD